MGVVRSALLWASTNGWLADRAVRTPFVRRSVARFMPGETMGEAIDAAKGLTPLGIGTILTYLGENLSRVEDAARVRDHYVELFDEVCRAGLDAHVSVKATQLGYDQDPELCARHLEVLAARAVGAQSFLWLDMERSSYVDGTIALYRELRTRTAHVGLALQAYLYRTPADVDALAPLGAAIRLVKGAYLEPASVAYPRKADVDRQYFALARRLLESDADRPGALLHIATHDVALQERLRAHIAEREIARDRCAFAMLYGIGVERQRTLAGAGEQVRCLISYGSEWFPWYVRRLAERPANLWFVARNLVR